MNSVKLRLTWFDRSNPFETALIRVCMDEKVLAAYLNEHEKEAVTIMMALFDEEYIQKAYGREMYSRGRNEGRAEGKAEGKKEGFLSALATLVKNGLLSLKDASAQAGMTEQEFTEATAAMI